MILKKTSPFFLALLASAAPLAVHAQTPAAAPDAPAPASSATPPASGAASGMRFSAEDGQKIQAARMTAMKDPAVQSALVKETKAANDLRAALLAQDKSLGPILDKIPNPSSTSPGAPPQLTSDERAKIIAARESLKNSPEGLAMETAALEFRTALKAAMTAADPTVGPVLDKLDAAAAAMRASRMGAPAPSGPRP